MRSLILTAAALGAFATGCCNRSAAAAPAAASPKAITGPSSRVPGEYLVTLAPGAGPAVIEAVFGSLGIARVQGVGGNVYLVAFRDDPGPERLESLRAKDARVQAVQPNFTYRAL
jgi:hypothetical protein